MVEKRILFAEEEYLLPGVEYQRRNQFYFKTCGSAAEALNRIKKISIRLLLPTTLYPEWKR